MSYQYKSQNFSGPLDLLWKMLRKEELDISQISLAHLTDQFLVYLKENEDKLNSDDLVEFLRIATLLLKMKLKYINKLWQSFENEDEDEELLLFRLKIYDVYHKAFLTLLKEKKFQEYSNFSRDNKKIDFIQEKENVNLEIDLEKVQRLAKTFLADWQNRFKEWQINKFKLLNIKEKIEYLTKKLEKYQKLDFNQIIEKKEKSEMIATFLALLELIKNNHIELQQEKPFNELIIYRK